MQSGYFETSGVLFVSIVVIHLVISLFFLGGRQAFFEPYKAPPEEQS
ncbi:MAG: hypothetical protein KC777_17565 [Cyanobacteria bacterium HKST-UBA02]|nr:hypothetical protein [Cyanobacteria bacterium HKST-UBA02]